ncbi:MAG: hypothetical protein IPL59_15015 [Candidatus Competibacteraceae bacterium]|nr:hypothetical protein [Candidatus Competibacteraceae bacterium]
MWVPVASSVVRSARFAFAPWAGCALGVSFRPSARSLSGFVAVARFFSAAGAAWFAASWVGGCPPRVAAVAFAWWWFRVCPAGWSRFRLRRRPLPLGVVAPRAPSPPRSRPGARLFLPFPFLPSRGCAVASPLSPAVAAAVAAFGGFVLLAVPGFLPVAGWRSARGG